MLPAPKLQAKFLGSVQKEKYKYYQITYDMEIYAKKRRLEYEACARDLSVEACVDSTVVFPRRCAKLQIFELYIC